MSFFQPLTDFITRALSAAAEKLADAAMAMLDAVIWTLTRSPEPDLIGPDSFFRGEYSVMLQIALYLCVPFVLVAFINAVLKGGVSQVMRTMLIGVPIAALGGVAAVWFIQIFQSVVDSFCNVVAQRMITDYQAYSQAMRSSAGGYQIQVVLGQIVLMAAMLVMAFFVVIEMYFRTIGIYVAALFLPLALAAYIWEATRGWFVKLVEVVAVLILSKLIIVIVFAFSLAVLGNLDLVQANSFWQSFGLSAVGLITLFFAGWASPVLLTMVLSPSFEDESTRAKFGANSPLNADRAATRGIAIGAAKSAVGMGKK